MMPAHFDEQWKKFREICEQTGILPGGETDWIWAAHGWTRLDNEQRQKAIQDVKERNLEDYSIKEALPQNYIVGRYWTRPHKKPKRVTERRQVVIEEPAFTEEQVAQYEAHREALFQEWWEQQPKAIYLSHAERDLRKEFKAAQFWTPELMRQTALSRIKAEALKSIAPSIEEWAKVNEGMSQEKQDCEDCGGWRYDPIVRRGIRYDNSVRCHCNGGRQVSQDAKMRAAAEVA